MVMVRHVLQHGTADTTLQNTVFHGDDAVEPAGDFLQQLFVERLGKAEVIVCDADVLMNGLPKNIPQSFCSRA